MKNIVLLFIFLFQSLHVYSDVKVESKTPYYKTIDYIPKSFDPKKQTWFCSTNALGPAFAKKIDLMLVKDGEKSYLDYGGDQIQASYDLRGFDRRWDWGDSENSYGVILIGDEAGYYDFSGLKKGETTEAQMMYKCHTSDDFIAELQNPKSLELLEELTTDYLEMLNGAFAE